MPDQEKTWQRNLRQAQNASNKNDPPQNNPPQEEEKAPMTPELLESKPPKEPKATEEKKGWITEKIRKLTSRVLLSSLMQIFSTMGLAFWAWPYVAFHYTMSYIGGPFASFFPRPGRELIKPLLDKLPVSQKVKKWTEETIGKIIELFELMLVSCCCCSCLVPVLAILFCIWVFISPCTTIEVVFGKGWIYSIFCGKES